MEPRKEVLKKIADGRKKQTNGRFQIVKLEERIAPAAPCCFTNHNGKLICPRGPC